MKSGLVKLLESIFSNDEVTDEEIIKILGTSDKITSTLFDFINQELPYINESIEKREVFQNTWNYLYKNMKKDLENNLAIPIKNLKNLQYKIRRLPRIKQYEKEKQGILNQLEELIDKNRYAFLEYIVYEIRNLDKLSMVLKKNKDMVNLKDKENVPFYYRMIQEYIKAITSIEYHEKDILYFYGVLLLTKNKYLYEPKDFKNACLQLINEEKKKLDIKDSHYKERKKLLKDLYQFVLGKENGIVDAFELLGKNHIPVCFCERVIGKMHQYTCPPLDNKRIFLDEYTITIDKKGTKEIDDALTIKRLSNGNYLLGCHITNVLGYLPYHSEIVNNAIERGKTIYIQDYNPYSKNLISIFPLEFVAYHASLVQNQKRLANSYFVELDSNANVVDFYILKTIIRNDAKCSYSYINKILKTGCQNRKMMETLLLLDELTYKLEENLATPFRDKRSEAMVELTTKLVNSQIANFFYENRYPLLYRVHELEKEKRQNQGLVKQIKSDTTTFHWYKEIEKSYCTKFDTKGFHECLNNIPYCHATSPLRRAEDIIVEHCLDICYFQRPTNQDLCYLEEEVERKKDIINLAYDRIEMFSTENSFLQENRREKMKNLKK